jgi:hypothetical protein
VIVSLRSTPKSIAHASPTLNACVSPTFANTRGPYSPNSRFMLDCSCMPDHGVLRTPDARHRRVDELAFGVLDLGEQVVAPER